MFKWLFDKEGSNEKNSESAKKKICVIVFQKKN